LIQRFGSALKLDIHLFLDKKGSNLALARRKLSEMESKQERV
jgi:hypothetical protein